MINSFEELFLYLYIQAPNLLLCNILKDFRLSETFAYEWEKGE